MKVIYDVHCDEIHDHQELLLNEKEYEELVHGWDDLRDRGIIDRFITPLKGGGKHVEVYF